MEIDVVSLVGYSQKSLIAMHKRMTVHVVPSPLKGEGIAA
jgi:hypothetical protein